jgi:Protein of unknown function (DUF1769)
MSVTTVNVAGSVSTAVRLLKAVYTGSCEEEDTDFTDYAVVRLGVVNGSILLLSAPAPSTLYLYTDDIRHAASTVKANSGAIVSEYERCGDRLILTDACGMSIVFIQLRTGTAASVEAFSALIVNWRVSTRLADTEVSRSVLSALTVPSSRPSVTRAAVVEAALRYQQMKEQSPSDPIGKSPSSGALSTGAVGAQLRRSSSTGSKPKESTATRNNNASPRPQPGGEWEPPLGKRIRSLYPSLLHQEEFRPITANSPAPVPFQNELFSGVCLLLVNTKTVDDLYHTRFEGTKYTFEVQVQGKFLKTPPGHIFFGAEISKKMELGLLTRGMCGSILQIGRTVNAYLHHSFGDKNNHELPHISGPLWSAVDRLVITPEGSTPPILGGVMPEDPTFRANRRKSPDFTLDIDLQSTYTFTFKTSNLDLVDWKCVNIPLMKGIDLHTFWNDADLTLIAYSIPFGKPDEPSIGKMNGELLPKLHPRKKMNYWFALEIKHQSNHPEVTTAPVGLDYSPPLLLPNSEQLADKELSEHSLKFLDDDDVDASREEERDVDYLREDAIDSDSDSDDDEEEDEENFFDSRECAEDDDELDESSIYHAGKGEQLDDVISPYRSGASPKPYVDGDRSDNRSALGSGNIRVSPIPRRPLEGTVEAEDDVDSLLSKFLPMGTDPASAGSPNWQKAAPSEDVKSMCELR